jgi:hypothetical protein
MCDSEEVSLARTWGAVQILLAKIQVLCCCCSVVQFCLMCNAAQVPLGGTYGAVQVFSAKESEKRKFATL